jgi:hypothetical protein
MSRAWLVGVLFLLGAGALGACGGGHPETMRGTTADGAVWFAQVDGDEAVVVECRPDAQPRCVRYAPTRVSRAQYQAWRRAAGAGVNAGSITSASAKAQFEGVLPVVPIPPARAVPGGVI